MFRKEYAFREWRPRMWSRYLDPRRQWACTLKGSKEPSLPSALRLLGRPKHRQVILLLALVFLLSLHLLVHLD
jgi:hypothetical protein